MAWLPRLTSRTGPVSRRIFEAIRDDIEAGILPPGTRLPTHRTLAGSLNVTTGTIARAYAEAQASGLIRSGVGQGSFVSETASQRPSSQNMREATDASGRRAIDLAQNMLLHAKHNAFFRQNAEQFLETADFDSAVGQGPHAGHFAHRQAGARWIAETAGVDEPDPDEIFVCGGGQHAIFLALDSVTEPGDSVLVEDLTYPGMKAAAAALNLKLVPVQIDAEGIVPDALDKAARTSGARVLYINPTMHSPTASSLPADRRRKVAEIAQRRDLTVIEDGVYDFLEDKSARPIAFMIPDRSLYLNSLSKAVSPGLQIGFLRIPAKLRDAATARMRAMCWSASKLLSGMAYAAIQNGTAREIMERNKAEATRRQAIAREIFGTRADYRAHPASYHGWLTLPRERRTESFIAAARDAGVILPPPEAFVATPSVAVPTALRLSLIAPARVEDLQVALPRLVELLQEDKPSYLSLV